MKYHKVELRRKGKKLILHYTKDNVEREEHDTSPNFFFYYYPETMSDAEAGKKYIEALIGFRYSCIEEDFKEIMRLRKVDVPTL